MEKKKGLKVTEKRHLLSPRDRETMMSILIRNPVVFETFRELLKFDHFSELDVGYALVWRTVSKFYDTYNELPDRSLLMTELESVLDNSADSLNDTERSDMEAFVDYGTPLHDDNAAVESGQPFPGAVQNQLRRERERKAAKKP